jgi:phosphinothricin acetyltransferase
MAATPRDITLRDAAPGDAEAVAAIYAHYVHTSIATFEEAPPDVTEIAKRIAAVQATGLPWLVATGVEGGLLGYAYASPYRTRSAYRYTLENSVYVAPQTHGLGIGATLMRELIERCRGLGYRQMLAVIGDSANVASIALHASLGFQTVGTHRAIGYKHARWVDVVHMQLPLGEGDRTPPEK